MSGPLPPGACAAALATLPGIGPNGLARMLVRHDPVAAWEQVLAGELCRPGGPPARRRAGGPPGRRRAEGKSGPEGQVPGGVVGIEVPDRAGPSPGPPADLRPSWAEAARRHDLLGVWQVLCRSGIGVTWLGDDRYPAGLTGDPEPAGVLFWRGRLEALGDRSVAVVGTRACTGYGRDVARRLGRDLAGAGVHVVSGLALGIDGAAHAGALAARPGAGPVGLAASGVDRPYPVRHRALWEAVAAAGVLLSETPPGWPAEPWRFPARNRLIAALSRLVVVVESSGAGGSMHTVEAALSRGIDVGAVPGPVTSPASDGTNRLLADGAMLIRSADDVLDLVDGVANRRPAAGAGVGQEAGADGAGAGGAGAGSAADRAVLAAVDRTPTPANLILVRLDRPLPAVSVSLHRLAQAGLVVEEGGRWRRTD